MTSSVARRYAGALADIALEEGRGDQILVELHAVQRLFSNFPTLHETLINPALPFSRKRSIIEVIAPQIPVSRTIINFLLLLLRAARLKQFDQVVEAYEVALDDSRGIIRGTVSSARPLDELTQRRLESALADRTGKMVRLSYFEDPSLIGGFKVQLGSTVVDGSIRAQLEQIREQLKGD
ncbi:MAG TPA: ATP synthase F1 subunit delta [Acidobacteriota bacterium]|nr:ATP synthase F1 subunit delta [Acidobacteriota bacterium]